jgi:hypothetical protein
MSRPQRRRYVQAARPSWSRQTSARRRGGALAAGGTAVSTNVVERPDAAPGIQRGQLVRDRDGHGLLIAQQL